MKILIAEDEKLSRRMLERTLQRWGYEVVATGNGAEAWEAFQKNHFPIVVTDWMMPVMDGVELVKRIRRHQQQTLDYVYIIILTARSDKEDLVEGMDAGADDFVGKPFHREELRVRLRAGERLINLEKKLYVRNAALEKINHRMKWDLEAAAAIQQSLLPSKPPETKDIRIAWQFRPCEELAGDILNVFNLDEKELGFYILDVSGHGVSAALLAVTLSRMLSPVIDQASLLKTRTALPPGYRITSPAAVANQLNKRFQMGPENEQYFTLLYGLLNKRTKVLRYVSAGHPGMVYLSCASGPTLLKAPSLPIGFSEDNRYQEHTLKLHPGDRFCLYSDGITEATNSQKEQFGSRRMLETLQQTKEVPLQESIDRLLESVQQWSQASSLKDDVTLLGFEISEPRP